MPQGSPNTSYGLSGSSKTNEMFGASDYPIADEGNLYGFTNPTPGTAIAMVTSVVDDAATQSSTHAQASPVLVIQNQQAAGSGINIYLQYLKMIIGQVPTSATYWRYALRLDPLSTKLTTAGTSITPVQLNPLSSQKSKASITFGANTTVIASAQSILLDNGQVDGAIPVTQDQWIFIFGGPRQAESSIGTKTLVKQLTINAAAVVIPPQYFFTLEMWGASNAAAPTWEFSGAYYERPAGQ